MHMISTHPHSDTMYVITDIIGYETDAYGDNFVVWRTKSGMLMMSHTRFITIVGE